MNKIFSKKKIVPRSTICSICYSKVGKNHFKCNNEKCVDGVICSSCQAHYQDSGLSSKCPVCRNESDAFIIQIKEDNQIQKRNVCKCPKLPKFNLKKKFNFLNVKFCDKLIILFEKNCCSTTFGLIFISLMIGYIECNIFGFYDFDPLLWFILGVLNMVIFYLVSWCMCANFCYIIHNDDDD